VESVKRIGQVQWDTSRIWISAQLASVVKADMRKYGVGVEIRPNTMRLALPDQSSFFKQCQDWAAKLAVQAVPELKTFRPLPLD
jgi:hypothetical protein